MDNQGGAGQVPHYYQFGTGYGGGQAPLHPFGGANNLGQQNIVINRDQLVEVIQQ